ncbi:unnamed protein product [Macrosiphum euphorbiae]|uniref:P-type ATPase C-terminal domain-containing protein n=1 Tax=Macrosiphum euphorbiae TaxID=13131 RepID=A0AAV0XSY9_9HEMI|nr:unnamed protein product [Macrosiphum euphorbiae]
MCALCSLCGPNNNILNIGYLNKEDWFINNDIDMYQEESNTPARVRSHNLNVELAKVKYIFSDKTGTLTKNVMKLKHCSIAGELYLEGSQNKMINNSINHSTKNYILDFLRIMSVCHTVIPEKSKLTDEIVYNASSPVSLPIVMGLFLTTCSTETRLKCPQLYYQTQNVFNFKMFWIWIVNALFHSLLLFWLCLFIMRHEVIWTKGRVGDYSVFGNVIYTCTLIIVCFKSGLHIQSWSLIVDLAIWVSILLWILFIMAYNELKIILMHFTVFINVNEIIFSSSIFWITIIFTASVVLLLDIVIITIQQTLSNETMIKKNGNLEK